MGKFSCSINLEIRVDYDCKKGVSNNWSKEHANARGYGSDQVISEYSTMSQDECRKKCEYDAAVAYNWQKDGSVQNHGCRCYGTLAAENIKMDTRHNWLFCKTSGN